MEAGGQAAGEDITAGLMGLMEEPEVGRKVDPIVDYMADLAILAESIEEHIILADSMEDPGIMAELSWDSAPRIMPPLGAGVTRGTPQITIATLLRMPIIRPMIFRHLLLGTLTLRRLPKILVLGMSFLLPLQRVRFHQIPIKEDAKNGHQRVIFMMSCAGIP